MAKFLFYDDKLINLMQQDEKPCGGSAVQTYGWIMGLMEEDQDVYVMTDMDGKIKLKEECSHINLVPMYDNNRGVRWLRWLYYRLPYTYKKLKAIKPDYLYVSIPGWTSALIGVMCRLLKIKFIQRISSDIQLDERFRKEHSIVHQFFLKLGLRLAHHILCQNNYQLMIIKKKYPGKSGIKISNPLYAENQYPVGDVTSRRYIAWLGIYRYPKNLKLLFQIASLLKNEQFLIAGKESSNCDEETCYYLEKLKHLSNVKFTGFLQRADILPFLANVRFLLNTSHFEGFSNTFLEALAVGTPILSSVNVNPDSIISKNNLGIVYNDVFDLCTQHASVTPELYQLMSENARKYVTRNHGYRFVTRKLLKYLAETDHIISDIGNRTVTLIETTQSKFTEHDAE